ncbi:MAG: hypothetical protein QG629_770 [Patescibacteria group bacterium]|nr:hypothetical protein [Patescibacteria group bacterium]
MNLGASVSQLIESYVKGVWICMHGRMLDPLHTKKNVEERVISD